jgi:spoIIIJ-associated protein
MNKKDLAKIVDREISKFIALSGVTATYDYNIEEIDDVINVNVSFEGDNLGYMIGNHGRHLDSLQYILQLMIRRAADEEDFDFRLTLDVSDYRKERDVKIEQIALQKADDARILGESIDLPPMKPYDRRVVHMTLQKFDDLKTESYGEGRDRYVRITPIGEDELGVISQEVEETDQHSEEEE